MSFQSSADRQAKHILMGTVLVIALVLGGVAWWFLAGPGQMSMQLGLCQRDNPDIAETVIIIDASDTWSELRRREVENDVLDRVGVHRNVSLYAVEADVSANNAIEPLIEICNPGSYDALADEFDVDSDLGKALAGNAALVAANYESFKDSILGIIDSIVARPSSDTSPIMETLRWTAVNASGSGSKPLEIFLISDLLQNSNAYSMYLGTPDLSQESAKALAGLDALGTRSLEGVEVFIYMLLNPIQEAIGKDRIKDFWTYYLANQGNGGVFPGNGARVMRVREMS